jgi:hypothetical protein
MVVHGFDCKVRSYNSVILFGTSARSTWQRSELTAFPQFFQEQGSTFVLLIGRWSYYFIRHLLPVPPPSIATSCRSRQATQGAAQPHSHTTPAPFHLRPLTTKEPDHRKLEVSLPRHRQFPQLYQGSLCTISYIDMHRLEFSVTPATTTTKTYNCPGQVLFHVSENGTNARWRILVVTTVNQHRPVFNIYHYQLVNVSFHWLVALIELCSDKYRISQSLHQPANSRL